MKIQIKGENHNFTLILPTVLAFSKPSAWLVNRVARKYAPEALAVIPPDALDALWAELRRIKMKYGSWTLVEVESAEGERVKITL